MECGITHLLFLQSAFSATFWGRDAHDAMMEVQLQLDGNGRTVWIKPAQEDESEAPSKNGASGSGDGNKEDASAPAKDTAIDFASKTVMTTLVPPPLNEETKQEHEEWRTWMDNILFDCEVSGCM
jgi:hypothetical protein